MQQGWICTVLQGSYRRLSLLPVTLTGNLPRLYQHYQRCWSQDPQVLATPGTSLALELSGCKQIEFEVRDDSPGLRYTAPMQSR